PRPMSVSSTREGSLSARSAASRGSNRFRSISAAARLFQSTTLRLIELPGSRGGSSGLSRADGAVPALARRGPALTQAPAVHCCACTARGGNIASENRIHPATINHLRAALRPLRISMRLPFRFQISPPLTYVEG